MENKNKLEFTVIFVCVALLAVGIFSMPVQAAQIDSRFVGSYTGTFLGGEDYGKFALTIQPDGNITGYGQSTKHSVGLTYSGFCQPDGTFQFRSNDGYLSFEGHIDWMNRMFGRWSSSDNSAKGSLTAVSDTWAK